MYPRFLPKKKNRLMYIEYEISVLTIEVLRKPTFLIAKISKYFIIILKFTNFHK